MRRVSPLCALEDYLVVLLDDRGPGTIDYTCENPSCADFTFRVSSSSRGLDARTGIAAEFGVYDDLLECIAPDDPWLEYGIVEYRYARLRPDVYLGEFFPRWGHTCQGPRRYSVSSFLGGTLGSLFRSGDLAWRSGPATGYWSYNHRSSYVSRPRVPAPDRMISWDEFARSNGIDPFDWPLPKY